jgi:hypothetical protein
MPDSVIGEVYYREAVRESYLRFRGDTLLLATGLVGALDMKDLVFAARMDGLRVVYLVGEPERATSLPYDLLAMGVYDLLFSPINAEDIILRLKDPAGFPQAAASLRVQAPQGGNLLQSLVKKIDEAREQSQRKALSGEDISAAQKDVEDARAPSRERRLSSAKSLRSREKRSGCRPRDEALKAFQPGYPILPVWSPAPAGKTFVATNLAWVLSLSGPAALVDLDKKQAVRDWLLIPEKEESLLRALRESGDGLPDPAQVGDLKVYCYDPAVGKARLTQSAIARLFSSGALSPGPVVIDMPADAREMEEWGYDLLRATRCCVIVGDPDWSHSAAARRAIDWATKEGICPVPVLNRYAVVHGVPGWSMEEVLDGKPAAMFEARDGLVYSSIATGKPAVVLDPEWKSRFDELAVWALTVFSKAQARAGAAPSGAA